jgi:hypothetical protein
MMNGGGKGKALSFYGPERPLSVQIVALRAMFSLHLLEQVHSIYEHSTLSDLNG